MVLLLSGIASGCSGGLSHQPATRAAPRAPRQDQHGARDAEPDLPPPDRLLQPEHAPGGGQQHRGLAQRGDDRQRRPGQRRQHEPVRDEREEARPRRRAARSSARRRGEPSAGHPRPEPARRRGGPPRTRATGSPRRARPAPAPRRPGPARSSVAIITPVRSANAMPARSRADAVRSRSHGRWTTSRPANRRATPSHAAGREPLAQHGHGHDDREQRRAPAGQRVHDRQVAPPVRGREEDEVGDLHARPTRSPMIQASGGTAGRSWASQATMTAGISASDAATTPTVAVRSGSPAVLSRMFQAAWRTAATRDEAEG